MTEPSRPGGSAGSTRRRRRIAVGTLVLLAGASVLAAGSLIVGQPLLRSSQSPTLEPPPRVRPFPAPVTSRTVPVPSTIDATGVGDASVALNAFLATVPDGSRVAFPAGGDVPARRGLS